MSSVDGRLLPSRWSVPADGVPIATLLGEYATAGKKLGTDAWMFGKATLTEVFPDKYVATGQGSMHDDVYRVERHSRRMFIVIDPDADILFTDSTLRGDDILTVIPSYTPCDYLQRLRRMDINYLMVDDTSDLNAIFDRIEREFDLHSISLQGGGIIDGAALAQQVLSEVSLIVYPGIDGKHGQPSIFEYMGGIDRPAAGQSLRLTSVEQLNHGVVWMRYQIE